MSRKERFVETPNGTIDLTLDESSGTTRVVDLTRSPSRNNEPVDIRSRLRSGGRRRREPSVSSNATLGSVLDEHSTPVRRPRVRTAVERRVSPTPSPDVIFLCDGNEQASASTSDTNENARKKMRKNSTSKKTEKPVDALPGTPSDNEFCCSICFDTRAKVKENGHHWSSTVCGHVFCNECINGAIVAQGRCPTCRKKLTKRSVHRIYL